MLRDSNDFIVIMENVQCEPVVVYKCVVVEGAASGKEVAFFADRMWT